MKKFSRRRRRHPKHKMHSRSRRTRLAVESLEPRRMLHGGTDSPHDHAPAHALTDHIHAQLLIYVNGQKEEIPGDLGITSSGIVSFIHTHAGDELLHMEPTDVDGDDTVDNPTSFLTVGDFFETWRTNAGDVGNRADALFDETRLFNNIVDDTQALRMYVNGIQVSSYNNYEIHDADRIVIAYGSSQVVALQTNHGPILMEMKPADAPGTVANFLNYVNDGDYSDSIVHRSVLDFVIQGGGFTTDSLTFSGTDQFSSVPTDPPITNNFGLSNTRGTVAMARGAAVNSATSQWFVNLDDNIFLDSGVIGGYTVFAQVLDMAPVDAIAAVPIQQAGPQGTSFNELPVDIDGTLVVVQSVTGDGVVTGTVFDDLDGNGSQDAGESGLAGFTIYADKNDDGELTAGEIFTVTATDGSYQLRLPSGNQTIRQQLVTPYQQSVPIPPAGQTVSVNADGSHSSVNFANTVVPSPGTPDLLAAFDSGSDTTDNITSNNNSSSGTVLQFTVAGAIDGALIRLLAGNVEIGQGIATGGVATISTTGAVTLADGVNNIKAIQIVNGGDSLPGPALSLTVDTAVDPFTSTPPTAATIAVAFSYDVANPEEGDPGFSYALANAPSGVTMDAASGLISWAPVANQIGSQLFSVLATDAAGNQLNHDLNVTVGGEVLVHFTVELTDDQGESISSVTAGEEFILRFLVEDGTIDPEGLFTAYSDVLFDTTLATVVGPITFGAIFSSTQHGSTGVQNGILDEVGALVPFLDGYEDHGLDPGGQFLLFSVPVRADKGGELVFQADPADILPNFDTLLFSMDTAVNQAQIAYGSASLTVTVAFSAVNELLQFNEDSSNNTINVMANDIIPASSTVTITSVSQGSGGGTVIKASDGLSVDYTPLPDFFGEETFSYTIGDNTGDSSATVTAQVFPQNDPPTAVNDSFDVDEDSSNELLPLLANDSFFPDVGETLLVTSTGTLSAGGSVTIAGNGSHVLYTPLPNYDGLETFTYMISDGNGGTASATVSVDLQAVGDNPIARFDTLTVDEDSTGNSLDVLANDTSPDSNVTLLIVSFGTPSEGGVAEIAADQMSIIYSPAPDFFGSEAFTYSVSDGNTGTDTAVVFVDVLDLPDPPTANDDTFQVVVDSPGEDLDLLANDSSAPDGVESLTITAVTATAQGGTVSIQQSGSLVQYVPPTGFNGQDSFTYTLSDDDGLSDQALVTVNVDSFQPGDVSGTVFIDIDGNGIQDANEMVIQGITISLSGTDFEGTPVQLTRTTDSNGNYNFDGLAPGSYVITETQPAYLLDGIETVDPTAGTITGDNEISIQLVEGADLVMTNFAERGREAAALSLADFFSSRPDPSLLVCTGSDPGFGWVALDSSWAAFDSVDASLDSESSGVDITVVDAGQSQDITVDVGQGDLGMSLFQDTTNQLLGVVGTPESFGIQFGSSAGGDEADGESLQDEPVFEQAFAEWLPAEQISSASELEELAWQDEPQDQYLEAVDLLLQNWFSS